MNDFCSQHSKFNYKCKECCKQYQRKHYQENKEKYKEKHSAWYQENKEIHKIKTRGNHRKRRFGVDQEQFQQMLQAQGCCCAICSEVLGQEACVDHNHTTGKVRGLLCRQCNSALGLFYDNKKILENAIYYLEKND